MSILRILALALLLWVALDFLLICITSEVEFNPNDFEDMPSNCPKAVWIGADYIDALFSWKSHNFHARHGIRHFAEFLIGGITLLPSVILYLAYQIAVCAWYTWIWI
jgi:hypothetical protein